MMSRYLGIALLLAACGHAADSREGDARLCDALASSHETVKVLLDQATQEYAGVSRAIKLWEDGQKAPPASDDGKYSGAADRAHAYRAAAEAFCYSANSVNDAMRALTLLAHSPQLKDQFHELAGIDCHLHADPTQSSKDQPASQSEWSGLRSQLLASERKVVDTCVEQFHTSMTQRMSSFPPVLD
jgi:hypothetical protein